MSKKRPSEKPTSLVFGPFGPVNLKQVYQFTDYSTTVPEDLRYDGLGALLMLARVHAAVEDQPPLEVLAGIPTSANLLRAALDPKYARRKGYSDGAIRNMTSLVKRCTAASGVRLRLGRRRIPLPTPWQQLFDQLDPRSQMVLYPFKRWCVEEKLMPVSVTQSVICRYECYLDECVLRRPKCQRKAFSEVVRLWIKAQVTIPGWPQAPIVLVSKRVTYILPWTAFAPSLHEEVKRLMAAAMSLDVTVRGRRKRLNATTAKYQTYQIRRLASALMHASGCKPEIIASVKMLVDPTAARSALRFLAARSHARQRARMHQDNATQE